LRKADRNETETIDSAAQQAEAPALKKAWHYFYRSLRLNCPVCGRSPIFCSLSQIKKPSDWFDTLPGCPRCDYVYDREPGYFMLALWSFDYGLAALFGIVLLLVFYSNFQLATLPLLLLVIIPTVLFALLLVRHSKAFYLAIDRYFFHSDDV
jgi:hypothetical protein